MTCETGEKETPDLLQQMYGVKKYDESRPINNMSLMIGKLRTPSDITREGNNVSDFIYSLWNNEPLQFDVTPKPPETISLIRGMQNV